MHLRKDKKYNVLEKKREDKTMIVSYNPVVI